jgi:hypothetical protein
MSDTIAFALTFDHWLLTGTDARLNFKLMIIVLYSASAVPTRHPFPSA